MRGRWLWALALLVWAQGCSDALKPEAGPTEQHPVLSEPVEVRVLYGDDELVPETDIDIGFVSVLYDYRCPEDATCGWPGSATVGLRITLGSGPGAVFLLNTGVEPRSLALGDYLISVLGLSPERHVGDTIPTRKYQVSLRIENIRAH